jgi:Na+/H+ antiporter NhaD/arsenite permease-like protein
MRGPSRSLSSSWRLRAPCRIALLAAAAILLLPQSAWAATAAAPVRVAGIPLAFIMFGLTLLGVAIFHHRTLEVALTGLSVIAIYKILFAGFGEHTGLTGFFLHVEHEWVVLANLFFLLMGFGLLSRHFEDSEVPAALPKYLPDNWTGGLWLLIVVFVLSGFLDNIAAALIGGATAHTVFKGRVHIAYLAGLVAVANAGGAGSVIGDTTTTMMWISGISPLTVLPAYIAAFGSLFVIAVPAAIIQQRYAPILRDPDHVVRIDWVRVLVVAAVLVAAITTNVTVNLRFPAQADSFPFLGMAVALTLLVLAPVRKPAWDIMPGSLRGTLFLVSLVLCASMMPVEELPAASWHTALGLGFLSSVFDNIPLTALAIQQGGYDWDVLAFAVGFGGSMVWFGSSAGVAISNMYPEAKSVGSWVRRGWFVPIGYVVGFFVLLAASGWHPTPR